MDVSAKKLDVSGSRRRVSRFHGNARALTAETRESPPKQHRGVPRVDHDAHIEERSRCRDVRLVERNRVLQIVLGPQDPRAWLRRARTCTALTRCCDRAAAPALLSPWRGRGRATVPVPDACAVASGPARRSSVHANQRPANPGQVMPAVSDGVVFDEELRRQRRTAVE